MEFDKILEKRVSTRKFTEEKLSKDEIDALLYAAQKSPIGNGAYDTVHLSVITKKEFIEEISKEYNDLTGKKSDSLFGANTLILVSSSRDTLVEYEDVGCLIEHMALKATELGLGSCYIRGVFHSMGPNAKYIEKLNLPDGFRPISGLVVGKIDHDLEGKDHKIEISYIE